MKKLFTAVILICAVLLTNACTSNRYFESDYTIDREAPYFQGREYEPYEMKIYGIDEGYVTPNEKTEPIKRRKLLPMT